VNNFLKEYGRLVPHGDAPQVGVGGHYTVGGLGRISRTFGAATDQIIDAEVVTADGSIVTVSAQQNQDLFFAIRGAGASFGIVTNFHVNTHPDPGATVAYSYNLTIGDAKLQADAFKAWQKLISDPNLTWKFSSQFIVFPVGSLINGFFFGTEKEFSSLNLESAIPGLGDSSTKVDIRVIDSAVAVGQELADLGLQLFGGVSTNFYSKSLSFSNRTLMSDEAIDAMFAYLAPSSAAQVLNALKSPWFIIFDLEGGAINQPSQDSTAYAFRDALYFIQSYAVDLLGIFQKDTRGFLDGLNKIILDYAEDKNAYGSYPGYVDPFLQNAQSMYWRGNLPRLQQVKKKYDPGEVFWNLQSVKPAQ
jgi:FAD/FMN-containing dehydrogenase